MPDVAKYQPQKQTAMTSTTTEILPCQGDSGAKLVGMVDVMDIDTSLKYLKAREFDKKAGITKLWRGEETDLRLHMSEMRKARMMKHTRAGHQDINMNIK